MENFVLMHILSMYVEIVAVNVQCTYMVAVNVQCTMYLH